ncbi:sodium-coupled monocarboxylate transporter 1-like [Periplaneta americana]|uniref:sodium-coupled monocarboxylate transporter 1-like n=1 Tax=Periplaneta americana TaxID=6978 RepID=UPI0037E8F23B
MNFTGHPLLGSAELLFGWLDYSFFVLMLVLSTLIGIYFGFWGNKSDTPEEYLLGGKSMATLPVAVSLVASDISGITIMGDPAEAYTYGTLYWLRAGFYPLVILANNYLYLPVFYELQLTSIYEYLQLRFNRSVRVMASVLCTVGSILYIPIIIYVPALALSQVTGLNMHIITPVISIVCIFYTMLGGIKAVVWTDFLQGVVMVGASIVVITLGLIHVGGFGIVWQRSLEAGRINIFEMNPSPFERLSFWIIAFGGPIGSVGYVCVNQGMVQRFLSLPNYKEAQKSLLILAVGFIFIKSVSTFMGLTIFATYYDCDPLKTKAISRSDQLIPYYIMDVASLIPGLPGLFVAGIFSAALSTMSTVLNSLAATLFEDFVRPCLSVNISDRASNNIIKLLVVIIGAICVVLVIVVDKIGGVVQLTMSTSGVTNGATIGLFSFGMFYPRGNAKGALIGSIVSLLSMGWLVFGTQKAIADGTLRYPKLPTSAAGCGFNDTLTEVFTTEVPREEPFILYRISFLYYPTMGLIIMFVVGMIVSHFTEPPNIEQMNPKLFTPIIRKRVLEKRRELEMKIIEEKSALFDPPAEFRNI